MPGTLSATAHLLQSHFDKVLVLTVPRFKERQAQINEKLAGISFDFFYGTDKNELAAEFIRTNYVYDKKNSLSIRQQFKELNKGELACSLSHRLIYQAMLDNNWRSALIFEDDVVPDFDKLEQLPAILQELPSDWELLYLGYLKNEKPTTGKRLKQFWYTIMARLGFSRMPLAMIKRTLPASFSPHLYRAGFHDCTHAYAVSLSGAKKLLRAQTPVQHRADNLLSRLVLNGELNAFASKSFLFNQEYFSGSNNASFIREPQKLSVP